jgi:crotonobetainyl-CoA:carnitine CoA-transferase CaiB-like acyl-CoA transferase
VADWTSKLTAEEITARCVEYDVPVGTAYSAADIFADPHMAARHDLVVVDDPVIGPVRQQAPFPRLAKSPASVPRGAPRLGEHNREVWCDLVGLGDDELADLASRGVV